MPAVPSSPLAHLFRLAVPAGLAMLALGAAASARTQDDDRDAVQRAAIDKEFRGLVPGKAQNCLSPSVTRSASSRIYGSTIVYQVTSGLKYRSDTRVSCTSSRPGADWDTLVTSTPTGQNCSGDPVQVVDRFTGVLRGVCAFGPFVPYRRK